MRRYVVLTGLTVLAWVTGCKLGDGGGDSTNNGTGDPSAWTLTATFARPTMAVQHGSSDTVTVIASRGGGFTGAIQLFADTLPGLAAVISNVVNSGTTTTGLLTVTAGTSANDFVYSIPIGVHAEATGVELHSDPSLMVTVTRKNGFWITAPGTLSVARGGASGPISVHFTKTGFTDDVTLSLPLFNAAPAGITATFAPNPIVQDTTSTMTVLVDASVPEGTYSVGTRANGGGFQGTAPMTLTVTTAPTLTMTAGINPLIVPKGGSNSTFITFTRTNLTAGITLTVTSTLPAGVLGSFAPPTSFGPTTSLTVSATPGSPSGTFVMNITSGGVGVPVVTIPVTVTIP